MFRQPTWFVKQWLTNWRRPMICYLVKRAGRGRYRLAGMPKPVEVPLKTTDKQVAQTKLLKLVKEAEQERAGIIAPKSLRDGAQRRLKDHLADCTWDLEKLVRDSMYVYNVDKLVDRLLNECNWDLPMDVTADSFQGWRGNQDKAPKTLTNICPRWALSSPGWSTTSAYWRTRSSRSSGWKLVARKGGNAGR